MTKVRIAQKDDVDEVARSLGRAFEDDPAFTWMFPDAAHRARCLPRLFRTMMNVVHMKFGLSFTTDDRGGAALWDPPGHFKVGWFDQLRLVPALAGVFGRRSLPALGLLHAIEQRHPVEPHFYLSTIGIAPEHQGRGLGKALLAPVLERCDREGKLAYLESSNEKNHNFYRRAGFEVIGEHAPPGGPHIWFMQRRPAS